MSLIRLHDSSPFSNRSSWYAKRQCLNLRQAPTQWLLMEPFHECLLVVKCNISTVIQSVPISVKREVRATLFFTNFMLSVTVTTVLIYYLLDWIMSVLKNFVLHGEVCLEMTGYSIYVCLKSTSVTSYSSPPILITRAQQHTVLLSLFLRGPRLLGPGQCSHLTLPLPLPHAVDSSSTCSQSSPRVFTCTEFQVIKFLQYLVCILEQEHAFILTVNHV